MAEQRRGEKREPAHARSDGRVTRLPDSVSTALQGTRPSPRFQESASRMVRGPGPLPHSSRLRPHQSEMGEHPASKSNPTE